MIYKRFLIFCLVVLLSKHISAQVFHSLLENQNLKQNKTLIQKSNGITLDTISVPFFEDFSESGMYPNSTKWVDNDVYVNRSFASAPPSIGVATFDIIDAAGEMYKLAGTSPFLADNLTSMPIDLEPYSASDSIYLSFFYQPQGLGWDMPDQSDSLILKFKNNAGNWIHIWSVSGSGLQAFKQIILPVVDTQFLYKGFQFRFSNYASLGDPQIQEDAIKNDFWNLDYIVLDTARTAVDTSYQDISFYESKGLLFSKYRAVPWKHFDLNQLDKDTMNYHIRNLDNSLNAIDNMRFHLKLGDDVVDAFSLGTINITEFNTEDKDFSYQQMLSSPGNPSSSNIPNQLTGSTRFEVIQYFDELAAAKPYFTSNDTLKFYMNCHNYYAFDDGSSELGLSLIESGTKLAYKIEGLKDDTLRGVSILFNQYKDFGTSQESIFNLCVWDNNEGVPGTLIHREENVKIKYALGIDHFAYFEFETSVYVDKTFFVGLETTNGKLYSIGYDINNHYEGQTYFWRNNWSELPKGTPMIRPYLGEEFTYIFISDVENSKIDFKIFPNPVQNEVYISLGTEDVMHTQFKVEVLNLQGQIIEEASFSGQNCLLHSENWAQGIYIVKVSEGKRSNYRKLIKN